VTTIRLDVSTSSLCASTPTERVAWLETALSAAQGLGRKQAQGNHLGNLGNAYSALGEVARAIEYYEQALTIAREIGDRRGEAFTSWNLGLLYEDSDPARAVELMSVCVDYERWISHPDAEADAEQVAALLASVEGAQEGDRDTG
jgi:tetratricopeptide (TPR) repeat protein